jgi:hypothetical protein
LQAAVPQAIAEGHMVQEQPEQRAMLLRQAQGLAQLPIATAAWSLDLPIVVHLVVLVGERRGQGLAQRPIATAVSSLGLPIVVQTEALAEVQHWAHYPIVAPVARPLAAAHWALHPIAADFDWALHPIAADFDWALHPIAVVALQVALRPIAAAAAVAVREHSIPNSTDRYGTSLRRNSAFPRQAVIQP